jgi:hypothetical protein
MDVGDWLKGISLEKYEETFSANAIDGPAAAADGRRP